MHDSAHMELNQSGVDSNGAAQGAFGAPSRPVTLADVRVTIDPADGVQLVSPRDAARLMGCGKRTIYQWIADGKVAVRVTAGGRLRVIATALIKDDARDARRPNGR